MLKSKHAINTIDFNSEPIQHPVIENGIIMPGI